MASVTVYRAITPKRQTTTKADGAVVEGRLFAAAGR